MNVPGAAVPPDYEEDQFILPSQSTSSSEDEEEEEEEEEEQEQEMQQLPMTQNTESVIHTLLHIKSSCATADIAQEPVHAPFDPSIDLAQHTVSQISLVRKNMRRQEMPAAKLRSTYQ